MGGLFVTGTDTGVGKTVVSAWLALHLCADYWKPVQSGLDDETDAEAVARLTGDAGVGIHPCAFELTQPLSPHEAARRDGITIKLDDFTLPETDRPLIVEGAGGLLVPLNDTHYMIDLIERLGLPCVLVARSGLGTINHTLLSLAALRTRGLPIECVVINGPENPANRKAIEDFGGVPVLPLPFFHKPGPRSLAAHQPEGDILS